MNFKFNNLLRSPDFAGSGTFTSLGGKSKTTFLATEEEKISIEFVAKVALKKGQPVKLDAATGQVDLWATADGRNKLIGYVISDVAATGVVTVWTRGFALIYALAPGAQNAGPATCSGYDSSTSIGGATGYSIYTLSSTDTAINAWVLDVAAGATELIRVLLMD